MPLELCEQRDAPEVRDGIYEVSEALLGAVRKGLGFGAEGLWFSDCNIPPREEDSAGFYSLLHCTLQQLSVDEITLRGLGIWG